MKYIIMIVSLALFSTGWDNPSEDSESELDTNHQATYLLNLVKYVDWKEDKTVIGVYGNSTIYKALQKRSKDNSRVSFLYFEDFEQIDNCHMVYLPDIDNAGFYQTQLAIGKMPVILVVNQKKFVIRGAEFGFYQEEDKIKFAVNKVALEETGIRVSNQLLDKISQF